MRRAGPIVTAVSGIIVAFTVFGYWYLPAYPFNNEIYWIETPVSGWDMTEYTIAPLFTFIGGVLMIVFALKVLILRLMNRLSQKALRIVSISASIAAFVSFVGSLWYLIDAITIGGSIRHDVVTVGVYFAMAFAMLGLSFSTITAVKAKPLASVDDLPQPPDEPAEQ